MRKLIKGEIAARAIKRHEADQLFPSRKDGEKRDEYVEHYWMTAWWGLPLWAVTP